EKQRGVLLAGSPGAGKSTLAQAIAEYLVKKDFIVKTMEEPRDLQVMDEITQYTSLDGDISETADVLLLVRPDYTIYDEVRKTPHFKVFADMRLAGVGMIGVTHANRAIDALQRLIGRVELGMVPQVVDTVVFVDEASIGKVYDINYTVKVPAGMMEQDLARPVIEVRDFETGEPEYEIYSFGEQVVVMPIEAGEGAQTSPVWYYAEREIEGQLSRHVRGPVDVEVTSPDSIKVYVPDDQIPAILGKGGKRIKEIEEEMGLNINVNSLKERGKAGKQKASRQPRESVEVYEEKDKVTILAGGHRAGDKVDVFAGRDFLFNATVGGDGTISIRKSTEAAKSLLKKFRKGKKIKIS
ncbi:MAG: ATPase, T2SS/T4P/T4SS family, partial [Thermoplasmatota archaeon]